MDKTVETPVEENVCRPTTKQECEDVTRNIIISVPKELHKQKCSNVTVTRCGQEEVQVPERRCHKEPKAVCTVATHQKCFDVHREVCIPVSVAEPQEVCREEPVDKCRMTSMEVCHLEPKTTCVKVPKEESRQECKQIPREVRTHCNPLSSSSKLYWPGLC